MREKERERISKPFMTTSNYHSFQWSQVEDIKNHTNSLDENYNHSFMIEYTL